MDENTQDAVPQVATEDNQVVATPVAEDSQTIPPVNSDASQEEAVTQSSPQAQAAEGSAAQYDAEIKSDKIETKRKTFFLDLKANAMGRYVKISERSSGKRSTVIVPEENITEFMEKLQGLFQ